MKILVTGADGFVGRHLCKFLTQKGEDVVAASGPPASGAAPSSSPGGGGALVVDVRDADSIRDALRKTAPEAILHLAGSSSVAQSHKDPAGAYAVNTLGVANMLAAARELCPKARILLVSSGEVYGASTTKTPMTESDPTAPSSPYAGSKLAAEECARQFVRSYGTDIVVVRPFNHLGPGQAPTFVVPSLAAQLASISAGSSKPILRVGNLGAVRDFMHVDDVLGAYHVLLRQGISGEAYNVCSGEGRSIRALLDTLIQLSGLTVEVEVEADRLRPIDCPWLVGDPTKIKKMGWARQKTVEDALRDVLQSAGAVMPAR